MTRPIIRWLVCLLMLGLTAGGCGATRSSPDKPLSAGGLTPSVKDPEAGLVALAPGFDVASYKAVIVERFDVTDSAIKDDDDRRLARAVSEHFQLRLVTSLRGGRLFQSVQEAGHTPASADGPTLRLRGVITRLGRGVEVLRMFWGLYGAGAARAQADMHLLDVASNRVVVVTSDRRRWSYDPTRSVSPETALMECFNDMARDLGRFLVRLSKGQAPPGVR